MEIRSRHHVHFTGAADLATANDFAHPGDPHRFAGSDLLSAGARRSWRETFLYLEVQNDADKR